MGLQSQGYYHIGETGHYSDQSPTAVALRDLMADAETQQDKAARDEQTKQQKIEALEQQIRFAKIDGFFPTPRPLIDRMIYEADIQPGMTVLEPSAGKGDIAEAVREAGADVRCCERHYSLCEIIEAKGFPVERGDFLELCDNGTRYDRVLMNPPFERGADAEHVRRAFKWLKPGGILVAIMSSGTFQRHDRRCQEFRDWLAQQEYTIEQLPAGSFKNGFVQTGVSTELVCIQAPGGEEPEDAEPIEDQQDEDEAIDQDEPQQEPETMKTVGPLAIAAKCDTCSATCPNSWSDPREHITEDGKVYCGENCYAAQHPATITTSRQDIDDPERFELSTKPVKTRTKTAPLPKARQSVLFAGMNLLPNQEDLFPTDGQIVPQAG
jgi:hypothetical protein